MTVPTTSGCGSLDIFKVGKEVHMSEAVDGQDWKILKKKQHRVEAITPHEHSRSLQHVTGVMGPEKRVMTREVSLL